MRITRVLTITFIIALSVSVASAQSLRKDGKYWIGEIEKSFKVEKGGTLIIEDVQADVAIKTWDKNEVLIHEIKRMDIYTKSEAEAAMEESETGYRKVGNTIEIGGPGFDRRWIHSRFQITLPKEFNCEIESEGGDLDMRGLMGDIDASTGGGDVSIYEIDGRVDASTGGGDVEIEKTSQKVTARTGGGDVDITDTEGAVKISTGGGDVTISNTKDEVQASTGGGDVEISKTEGAVNVSTGGGDIEIGEAGGNVEASTGGGEIDIWKVNGNFVASTGGGSINAKTVMGSLEISTGGGDVELEDVRGAIEVRTGGGDVTAELTLEDFSIDHHVTLATGGGDIDLTVPEKMPATIHAEIRFRHRNWEEYEITSDFPLKITREDEDSRYQLIQGKGDINGGGDAIRLKTSGGNIYIRKGR